MSIDKIIQQIISTIETLLDAIQKLTDKNILTIREKIKTKLIDKEYLTTLIIESILEKCIMTIRFDSTD